MLSSSLCGQGHSGGEIKKAAIYTRVAVVELERRDQVALRHRGFKSCSHAYAKNDRGVSECGAQAETPLAESSSGPAPL